MKMNPAVSTNVRFVRDENNVTSEVKQIFRFMSEILYENYEQCYGWHPCSVFSGL
jgi:hypothetical protein